MYANAHFLEKLGYRDLADLQEIPLLDLVSPGHHARLREHLAAAKRSSGTDTALPEARLSLRRSDELPINTKCHSFRTRFAGEDCIQLNLSDTGDMGVAARLRGMPWRHYLSLLFLLLFTILPSSLLLRLNIDNAPDVYFPDHEPAVVLDRELRSRFPNDQVFVLLFEGVALFSEGFLEAYDHLGRTLLAKEAIDDVISITTQDHIAGTEDDFIVERLVDVNRLSDSRPAERRLHVVNDELTQGILSANDGSALAMIVIPAKADNSIERLALEEAILHEVSEARLGGYLTAVAGQIPVDVAQLRSMLRDNMIFIPATVITGLSLIWWLFRRWLAVLLAGVAIGVVVNSTVAFYVIFGQPFTLVSSIIPPLLSALTVAALVHLYNGLYLASRRGLTGINRINRALAEVKRPALFAALTTAAGLASLGTSPIIPIRTFGLVAALGTLLIYAVVFWALPEVIARWDRQGWPRAATGARLVDRLVSLLYRIGLRKPGWVIISVLALLVVGIPQIAKVQVETNLQEFFHLDHPIRAQTRHIDEKLVGTTTVSVIFNTPARDGLKNAETLRAIHDFQEWVEQLPEVDRSFGLPDFVAEMHWAFNAEQAGFRVLPDDSQLITQYLLIYDGDDLYDFVDRDFQHSHIALNLNTHSANGIAVVLDQIRNYLDINVGDTLYWEIAGHGRLFADMEELLVSGQILSLLGALGLIFLLMLIFLRSPGAALLCMIPNLSPILLIFIIMGFTGIWLDMGTALIASVAVGVAVDDTIHVYHGFRQRIARGLAPVSALVRSYRHAGRAVVTTTIILSAQFLILVFSDFVPTGNFGLLTTIGLVTALLFDLLLLPALLLLLYGDNRFTGWIKRLRRSPRENAEASGAGESGETPIPWTAENRIALVKSIIGGSLTVTEAAMRHGLSEAAVKSWVDAAEQGMAAALSGQGRGVRGSETEVSGQRGPRRNSTKL